MKERGIGGVIKAYREQRGYSQGGLVRRVNATGLAHLTSSYVSMVEAGTVKNVGPDKLQALAVVFGVSVDTLLHEAGLSADTPAPVPPAAPAEELADLPTDLARDIARLPPKLRDRVAGYVRALVEETAAQEAQGRRKKAPHRAAEDTGGEEPPAQADRLSAAGSGFGRLRV